MAQNNTSKAMRGIRWTSTSTIVTSVLQIGYTSIMSRILDPSAFGLLAIAQIVLNFASYFSRMGLSQALIQKPDLSVKDIRAVFSSSVFLALIITTLIWFLAPYSTIIFDKVNDEVILIMKVMACSFLVGGLSSTSLGILNREMRFKQIAQIEITSYIIAYMGVGIIMGLNGYGVWSLVFANMSQVFIVAIMAYYATRHNVTPIFNWKYYRPFFSYGSKFSITTFFDAFGGNLPLILIGKFYGEYMLGIYRQAYMMIHLPLQKLTFSIQNVIFPVYSKIQTDPGKLKKAYLKTITLIATVLFPICFSISVASKEITLVLLGNKFIESYPILTILSLGIGFKFLSQFAGVVCDAKALLNFKLVIQISYLVVLLIATYIFRQYGLIGFACIVSIVELIRNIVFMILIGNMLKINLKEYVIAYYPGLLIGLSSALIIFLTTYLMNQLEIMLVIKLIIQILIGMMVVIYFTIINPFPILKNIIKENILSDKLLQNKKVKFITKFMNWYQIDN